jgi:hypothetical protein
MLMTDTYCIRPAADDDRDSLRRLAQLDSQPDLAGSTLIGEIDGAPAAAISLEDGRVIADPFRPTTHLVTCLHVRARALGVSDPRPTFGWRLRATLRPARVIATHALGR